MHLFPKPESEARKPYFPHEEAVIDIDVDRAGLASVMKPAEDQSEETGLQGYMSLHLSIFFT